MMFDSRLNYAAVYKVTKTKIGTYVFILCFNSLFTCSIQILSSFVSSIKLFTSLRQSLNPLLKDIVPLVDHGELHQQDEGGHHVVEVVLAVVELCEGRSAQQRVPAVRLRRVAGVRLVKLHLPFENLHPHHGKDVVHHLRRSQLHYQAQTFLQTHNPASKSG